MNTISRLYPVGANADMRRAFDYLYDLIGAKGNGQRMGVTDDQLNRLLARVQTETRQQATQLLGAFAQPLVGSTSSDPLLQSVAQAPGTGTVTNVSRVNNANFVTLTITDPTSAPVITVDPNPATGWGTPSSTLARSTFATYAGQTISALYNSTEVQAIDDHVKVLSQRLGALLTDLISKEILSA